MNRCGPVDKLEERAVENLFDFVSLPSLRNEGSFTRLRSYHRRSVGRERPRGVGKANERLPEHEAQEG